MIRESTCRTIAEHHRREAAKAKTSAEASRHLAAAEDWDKEARKARRQSPMERT